MHITNLAVLDRIDTNLLDHLAESNQVVLLEEKSELLVQRRVRLRQ